MAILQHKGTAMLKTAIIRTIITAALAATASLAAAQQMAAVVTIPTPPGATRAQLEGGFAKSVPLYQNAPGLVRKYFTISETGVFGGIYLWDSAAAAKAYYNDAWHARVLKTYGKPGTVTFYDVPLAIDGLKPKG